ncbi:MAG: aspartate kinase [Chloroflexota bacterium]
MKVFKFGGASVKDAEAVKNVFRILSDYKAYDLCIIFSAMGKTTNALEKVADSWIKGDSTLDENIANVEDFHLKIARDLGVEDKCVGKWINQLKEITSWLPLTNYDEGYDRVVSIGELLSTELISAFLNNCHYPHTCINARKVVKTDNNYRNASVDWAKTKSLIIQETSRAVAVEGRKVFLTQGFIGSTNESNPVTLGREGSDFSAAIFAWALRAEEMIIWKDVPGVLNADPRFFQDTVKIDRMTYRDAIELAYYGASVIHPKTIQPLQSSRIPLYVKSFYNPYDKGTLISDLEEEHPHIPSFIFKRNQVLISVSPRDFSFIAENNLQSIFGTLYSLGIHFNMMQHSAISFSIVIDDHAEKMQRLFDSLGKDYRVRYNNGLELITIRYYDQPTIDKVIAGRKVLLEQKSRTTVQLVVSE